MKKQLTTLDYKPGIHYSKVNVQQVKLNQRESNNITFGGLTGNLKGSKISTAIDQSFQMAMS